MNEKSVDQPFGERFNARFMARRVVASESGASRILSCKGLRRDGRGTV
jgi:hypothetical protein